MAVKEEQAEEGTDTEKEEDFADTDGLDHNLGQEGDHDGEDPVDD